MPCPLSRSCQAQTLVFGHHSALDVQPVGFAKQALQPARLSASSYPPLPLHWPRRPASVVTHKRSGARGTSLVCSICRALASLLGSCDSRSSTGRLEWPAFDAHVWHRCRNPVLAAQYDIAKLTLFARLPLFSLLESLGVLHGKFDDGSPLTSCGTLR